MASAVSRMWPAGAAGRCSHHNLPHHWKRHHPARRRARLPRPGHRAVVDGPGRQHGHRLAGHRRARRRGRAALRARPRRPRLPRSRGHRPLAGRVADTPGRGPGLTALANATTKCLPMIQIAGSSERRIVGLQRGDYEEPGQLAAARPFAKPAYRIGRARRRVGGAAGADPAPSVRRRGRSLGDARRPPGRRGHRRGSRSPPGWAAANDRDVPGALAGLNRLIAPCSKAGSRTSARPPPQTGSPRSPPPRWITGRFPDAMHGHCGAAG
jgi:hypothetical protein